MHTGDAEEKDLATVAGRGLVRDGVRFHRGLFRRHRRQIGHRFAAKAKITIVSPL